MLRSLLVALDDTPAGEAAAEYAIRLALTHQARLRGLAVVDTDFVAPPSPGRAGAFFYKERADAARLAEAHARDASLSRVFAERCAREGVTAEAGVADGQPLASLQAAANPHDAIVMGRDSDLHGEAASGCADTVRKLLKESPRPLIVVPAGALAPQRALVA
ncbi:MAG: universal stress protein, partial [Tagaea sp.]|nr:universal stress protein [Tagaea sp.]